MRTYEEVLLDARHRQVIGLAQTPENISFQTIRARMSKAVDHTLIIGAFSREV